MTISEWQLENVINSLNNKTAAQVLWDTLKWMLEKLHDVLEAGIEYLACETEGEIWLTVLSQRSWKIAYYDEELEEWVIPEISIGEIDTYTSIVVRVNMFGYVIARVIENAYVGYELNWLFKMFLGIDFTLNDPVINNDPDLWWKSGETYINNSDGEHPYRLHHGIIDSVSLTVFSSIIYGLSTMLDSHLIAEFTKSVFGVSHLANQIISSSAINDMKDKVDYSLGSTGDIHIFNNTYVQPATTTIGLIQSIFSILGSATSAFLNINSILKLAGIIPQDTQPDLSLLYKDTQSIITNFRILQEDVSTVKNQNIYNILKSKDYQTENIEMYSSLSHTFSYVIEKIKILEDISEAVSKNNNEEEIDEMIIDVKAAIVALQTTANNIYQKVKRRIYA